MQRLRITFAKTAAMQYTGHLDLHKTWERTLRRARLPLAYSAGFNPHPKIQLGAALPLGFTSDCELVDVWLETSQELGAARAALEAAAPPGLRLSELREVPERDPALQTLIVAAEYRVTLPLTVEAAVLDERAEHPGHPERPERPQRPEPVEGRFTLARRELLDAAELDEWVRALLAAPEIRRTRREKDYDLRPLIESLAHTASDEAGHVLVMRLAAREGATGRPEEVVEALGWPATSAKYHRQKLFVR